MLFNTTANANHPSAATVHVMTCMPDNDWPSGKNRGLQSQEWHQHKLKISTKADTFPVEQIETMISSCARQIG